MDKRWLTWKEKGNVSNTNCQTAKCNCSKLIEPVKCISMMAYSTWEPWMIYPLKIDLIKTENYPSWIEFQLNGLSLKHTSAKTVLKQWRAASVSLA